MKKIAFLIAGVYAALIALLATPLSRIAFWNAKDVTSGTFLSEPGSWCWLAALALAQFIMLGMPLRIEAQRPVVKRSILSTVIVTGLMMAALFAGAALAIGETIVKDGVSNPLWWCALGVLLLGWVFWAVVFHQWSSKTDPKSLVERYAKYLYRGSLLELLVAVPTHILARQRTDCCAGAATFTAIAAGLAVMLFSFGPGVFFLYAKRWKDRRRGRDLGKA